MSSFLHTGICQLCEDPEMEADDFRILVLAWYCQASQMCQFSREEFLSGSYEFIF